MRAKENTEIKRLKIDYAVDKDLNIGEDGKEVIKMKKTTQGIEDDKKRIMKLSKMKIDQ